MMTKKFARNFSIWLTLVMLMASLPSYSRADFFKLGDGWLDYGNGAINLSNVATVRPYVTYKLTLASDDEYSRDETTFISYSPDWSSVRDDRMGNFFQYFETLDTEPYYYVELTMGIYFDDFDLIYDEFRFLSVPDPSIQEDAERFAQIENAGLLEKFTEFLLLTKLEYSGEIDYDMELSEEDFMDILSNVEVPDDTSAEKIQLAFDGLEESYLDIIN